MSQSFWVSGAWERLRWLVLAMRVSWGGAGRTLVVWRHDKAGRSAPRFTHVDCLWRGLGAYHMGLSIRASPYGCSPHGKWSERDEGKQKSRCSSHNRISAVTSSHCGCIPWTDPHSIRRDLWKVMNVGVRHPWGLPPPSISKMSNGDNRSSC